MKTIVVLVTLLYSVSGIKKELSHPKSLIIEEAGVILKPRGLVTMARENLLVSVFKKIEIPQLNKRRALEPHANGCTKDTTAQQYQRWRPTYPRNGTNNTLWR